MITKCSLCSAEYEATRSTSLYCSDTCRKKAHRTEVSVTKPVLSVTKEDAKWDAKDEKWDAKDFSVTKEMERILDEAYGEIEKENKNRGGGSSGNVKIPDLKCGPHYVEGKRVLTEWEKMKLRMYGTKEVKRDIEAERKLVFTNETARERIEAYMDLYPEYTFIPNWILKGFNSMEEAIKDAVKDVEGSKNVDKKKL